MRKKLLIVLSIVAIIVCVPVKTRNQTQTLKKDSELKEVVSELSNGVKELNKAIIDINRTLEDF